LIDQEVELGETDVQVELVQPIQRLLDQTRAVRGLGKKLLKRIEDLIHESAALRTPVLSKLNQLSTSSAGIVNFGVRLAQLIGDYISSVKEKKEVFYISKVRSLVLGRRCKRSMVEVRLLPRVFGRFQLKLSLH
jgi:dynactin 1